VYTFTLSFTNAVVAGVNVAGVVIGIAFIVVDDVAAVAAAVVDVVIVGIV